MFSGSLKQEEIYILMMKLKPLFGEEKKGDWWSDVIMGVTFRRNDLEL